MDRGPISNISMGGQAVISEKFIKRTIWYAAMALKTMHDLDKIHRNISSDNF